MLQPPLGLEELRFETGYRRLPLIEDRKFQAQTRAGHPLPIGLAFGFDADLNAGGEEPSALGQTKSSRHLLYTLAGGSYIESILERRSLQRLDARVR